MNPDNPNLITITPERLRRAMKDDRMPLLTREYAELIGIIERHNSLQTQLEACKKELEQAKVNFVDEHFKYLEKCKEIHAMTDLAAENDEDAGKAQDQLAEAVKALEFYADRNSWDYLCGDEVSTHYYAIVGKDGHTANGHVYYGGRLARETIAKIKEK